MHLAIIGATGGCTLSCLHQSLESEQVDKITVLVRTPSKLTSLLENRNVGDSTKMHIVQGDAKDVEDVKKVIQTADVVVSGVDTFPFLPSCSLLSDLPKHIHRSLHAFSNVLVAPPRPARG